MATIQSSTVQANPDNSQSLSFNETGEARLIAAAKEIRPLLTENAQTHARIGEMTEEVVDAIIKAGFHNMAVPQRWSGEHLSAKAMSRISAELAKGCPSAAWTITITNSCVLVGSQMTDNMQRTLFANGTPMMAASIAGMGSLKAVDGGYLLSGRWDYCTNCHHARYVLMQGIYEETQPVMCLIPIEDLTRLDNWDMVGMRGTGSDSLVAENVFVPTELSARINGFEVEGGFSFEKEASDYWVLFPLLRAKAVGVLVGTVEGLLEAVAATASRPVVYSNYKQKQDSSAFRACLGETAAKISSARTIMDSANDLLDQSAVETRSLRREEALQVRAEVGLAIKLLGEAAHTLMDLAGSSGFSESKLAQRYWLDFNVGARHAIFNPYVSFEAYGDYTLGRELAVMNEAFL